MPEHSLVDDIANPRVWKEGNERAPHKPLLLLYALGRAERGEDRLIHFEEVETKLTSLLRNFGPPRQTYHPEYPFWRLQGDGYWEVPNRDRVGLVSGSNDPKVTELRTKEVRAGFREDIYQTLRNDSDLRREIAVELLQRFFKPTLHEEILNAVGLSAEGTGITQPSRDPQFRKRVLRAYEYRCTICGYDLKVRMEPVGLQAGHVQWHTHGGPDTVDNGLALCVEHHKLFDAGVVHLTTDYQIHVSESVHGSSGAMDRLRSLHGREAHLPQRGEYRVSEEFIDWHQAEVFKAPAKKLND